MLVLCSWILRSTRALQSSSKRTGQPEHCAQHPLLDSSGLRGVHTRRFYARLRQHQRYVHNDRCRVPVFRSLLGYHTLLDGQQLPNVLVWAERKCLVCVVATNRHPVGAGRLLPATVAIRPFLFCGRPLGCTFDRHFESLARVPDSREHRQVLTRMQSQSVQIARLSVAFWCALEPFWSPSQRPHWSANSIECRDRYLQGGVNLLLAIVFYRKLNAHKLLFIGARRGFRQVSGFHALTSPCLLD